MDILLETKVKKLSDRIACRGLYIEYDPPPREDDSFDFRVYELKDGEQIILYQDRGRFGTVMIAVARLKQQRLSVPM